MKLVPIINLPARQYRAIAFVALVISIALLGSLTAAQSDATETAQEASATRIVTDHESGSFTFIIDNEPAARLDKNGLHVLGDVTYGGLLIDKNEAVREALAGNAESSETKGE